MALYISFIRTLKSILLILLTLALLSAILYAGLNPKGYKFTNAVTWIENRPGINLGKYSYIYTHLDKNWIANHKKETGCFSIEMATKPENYKMNRFTFILSMHSGKDKDQLLIGQWRSYIIVMNGNDYSGRCKTPKISINMEKDKLQEIFLTITSDIKGTKVYVDGQLVKTNPHLALKIPQSDRTILTLGNSVYARHSWLGQIYGLAYYDHLLLKENAASHFKTWSENKIFTGQKESGPSLLYTFNEKQGNKIIEHITGKYHLKIPERIAPVRKNILLPDFSDLELNYNTIEDIILNFLGFIPLGLVLSVTIKRVRNKFGKRNILIIVAFCFLVSLTIEIIQAWIPSRSSSIIDLVLNTTGALCGSFCYYLFLKIRNRKKIKQFVR